MASYSEETSSPQISTTVAGMAVPGQLLPTKETLLELREKFLSVYDVASILESKTLPWYCIHRDYWKIDDSRAPPGPIPGNDYHARDPRINADPAAWAGMLRFDPADRSAAAGTHGLGPLVVPFKHVKDHAPVADGNKSLEEAAALIRGLWPDAEIGSPIRRFTGTRLTDAKAPEYQMFHWISSKRLDSEIVALQSLSRTSGVNFHETQSLVAHTSAKDGDNEEFEMSSDVRLHGEPFSSAQLWSFTEQESLISFPSIASILCLLTSPSKRPGFELKSQDPVHGFADCDISWCLDSLHGFCRRKMPEQPEIERSLSFTLGTSPDFWMYFHCVFHFYVCYINGSPTDTKSVAGSGMEIERGHFTVPIELGALERDMVFAEQRTWIGMRVATSYCGKSPDASPSAVGVVVSDYGRTPVAATEKDWDERGLQSPHQAPGVALFQMVLWQHINVWDKAWNRTLNEIDSVFKVKLHCQDDVDQLDQLASDESSKTCTRLIMVLLGFRNHTDIVGKSVRGMHNEWARTYPGKFTERLERFDVETQNVLLSNWKKVLLHFDGLSGRLDARIQKSIDELRIIRDGVRLHSSADSIFSD